MMLLLLPDAFHHLLDIDPKDWMNRMVDVSSVRPEEWLKMCRSVAADPDDDQRVTLIEDFLGPKWQAARPNKR